MTNGTRPRRVAPLDHDPDALKWARQAKGLSQAALARRLEISSSHLCEIEKGTRGPSPELLLRIATELQCPPQVLKRKQPTTWPSP
jgi:transcriptional regulator with XRE-family HTH domain